MKKTVEMVSGFIVVLCLISLFVVSLCFLVLAFKINHQKKPAFELSANFKFQLFVMCFFGFD